MIPPIGKLVDAVVAFRDAFANKLSYVAAFDAVIAASGSASREERDAGILALLDPTGPAGQAALDHAEISGYLCIASGALVEDGASTTLGLDQILDQLADGAALLAAAGPALADADLDETTRPPPLQLARHERRWVAGFKSHVRGAMARLARDVEARDRARAHSRLGPAIRALAERTSANHLRYIVEVFDMLDAPLVVVDLVRGGQVTRYRAAGIRNGFHLMTVLDGIDPFALDSDSIASRQAIEARHGYFTWHALAEQAGRFTTAGPGAMVLGELRAVDLPAFEGVRTVIRTEPPFESRSWSASLVAPFHSALHESLVVEQELAPDEARPLLRRMVAAANR